MNNVSKTNIGQFDHSMEVFEELQVDSLQVISLLPNLIPPDAVPPSQYPFEMPQFGKNKHQHKKET